MHGEILATLLLARNLSERPIYRVGMRQLMEGRFPAKTSHSITQFARSSTDCRMVRHRALLPDERNAFGSANKSETGGGGVGRMVILPALRYFGLMPVKAMHRTPPFALDPRQVGSSLLVHHAFPKLTSWLRLSVG